jgi:hypothetical protein
MIAIYVCTGIAILSILFLIGWFLGEISNYQQRIDEEEK